jgi:hypothetical protein
MCTNESIFKKEVVLEKYIFEKSFQSTVQLYKRHYFPIGRLHTWLMDAIMATGLTHLTFHMPKDAICSKDKTLIIDIKDLWVIECSTST